MDYLVYVEGFNYTGGVVYDEYFCAYKNYTICNGKTEEEVLKDWANKNNIKDCVFIKNKNDIWEDRGFVIRIVPLYNESPETNKWLKLEWN